MAPFPHPRARLRFVAAEMGKREQKWIGLCPNSFTKTQWQQEEAGKAIAASAKGNVIIW